MTNVHLVAGTRNGHALETHDHGRAPEAQHPGRDDWAREQGELLHAELEQRVERETATLRAEWRRDRLLVEALQRSLLLISVPPPLPGLDVEIASEVCRPEALVGSGFSDVVLLGGRKVALVLGAMCNKELAAALCVPQTLFALRLILSECPHPADALGRLNRYLCGAAPCAVRPYAALSLAVVDTETGESLCACAGSEPPLVLRADGTAETVCAGAVALGSDTLQAYRAADFLLGAGDALLLATGGITEARRAGAGGAKEPLGYEGLVGLALDAFGAGDPRGQMAQAVLEGAKAFAGGRLQDDACVMLTQVMPTQRR